MFRGSVRYRYLDGVEVKLDTLHEAVSKDDTYALCIRAVNEADQGTYSVRATSKAGHVNCAAKLVMSDLEEKRRASSAQFTSRLASDVIAVDGTTLELSCGIQGYPAPDISWFYGGGERLGNAGQYAVFDSSSKAVLTVANVGQGNAGVYTCKIKV